MFRITVFIILLFSFSTRAFAQFELGGGVAFTMNTYDVGAQIKSQYTFGQNWRAEFSMDGYVTDNSFTYYGDFNLNLNYIFAQSETIDLHFIFGGTLFYGSTRNVEYVEKGRARGMNMGVGFQYLARENVKGYMDGVITFTDFGNPGIANRFLFTMGVLYSFEK